MIKRLIFLMIIGFAVIHGQGDPFRNLGFDEADINNLLFGSPDRGGTGKVEDLLPGWQFYWGSALQSTFGFNLRPISGEVATLVAQGFSVFPPEGLYAVLFEATQQGTVPYSLVQRGDVPQDSMLLKLRYESFPFSVSMNGTNVPPTPRGSGGQTLTPLELFFDVSQFAGQNVELRLTTDVFGQLTPGDDHFLDSIEFRSCPGISGVRLERTNMVVEWENVAGAWLESGAGVNGPWRTLTNAPSPFITSVTNGPAFFLRIRSPVCP